LVSTPAHAIAGGSAVTDGSLSYVAKLQIGDISSCAGVLVAPQWVLTSADCFATSTHAAQAGPPPLPTTVTIGRSDLGGTGGHVVKAIKVEPRADRDAALVQLDAAITDITPIALAAGGPAVGDTLRTATFGRTATEWAPNRLQAAQFQVAGFDGFTVSMTGGTDTVSLCRGDAGGPVLTASNALLAVDTAAWSHGCLGSSETREGATATRVEDLGSWIQSFVTTTPDGYFQPVGPTRILDTRNGTGTANSTTTPVPPNSAVSLQITGRNGVPATDVTAVAMTVTVVSPSNSGLLIAYPDQTTRPSVSNIDFTTGVTLANYVIVPVGPNGAVSLYNSGGATTHLLADLSGYFTIDSTKPGGTTYTTATPARLLDTRTDLGHTGGRPAAGGVTTLTVGGVDSIPASGVAAIALNLTAVTPANTGFLVAYAHGATRPTTSNLQYANTAAATAVTAIVPVSADGKVDIWTSAASDLLADVQGYFSTSSSGMTFHAATPGRVYDSRTTPGVPIPANGRLSLPPSAVIKQPSAAPRAEPTRPPIIPPSGIQSISVYNVTIPTPVSAGFIENYADNTYSTEPNVSSIDLVPGQTSANLVLAPLAQWSPKPPATVFSNHSGSPVNIILDSFGSFLRD
jgi:hypothetical protein